MSFSDKPSGPFITPDQIPAMNRLAKSAVYWHGVYEDEMDKIKGATLKITNFLLMDFKKDVEEKLKIARMTPEQLLKHLDENVPQTNHPIIFPYAPENQMIFSTEITELETASHSIYPVILNIQKEYNSVNAQTKMMQLPQANAGPSAQVVMPQPRSFLSFGRKEKNAENVTDITAHSRSIDLIDRLRQVPVITSAYNHYHWQRVTDAFTQLRGKRKAQLNLLAVEIVHYNSVVKPMILNAVGEAMRLNLVGESADIVKILGRGQEMHERKEMQPKYTPPE